MANEPKTQHTPIVLGEIDLSCFMVKSASKRNPNKAKDRKSSTDSKNSYSSYLDEIEQREDMSKERKSTIRFFCEIVIPLYKILSYSKATDNICDYIDRRNEVENGVKNRAAVLDISSEEVFDTLFRYHQIKHVEELLYHFYTSISECKTLIDSLKSNDKIKFCQKIEEYNKVEIYELCLYYLRLERKIRSFETLFCIRSQAELDDYLERGIVSKYYFSHQFESSDSSFISINLLRMGTKWIEEKIYHLDTDDLKDYAISILSCIDKLNLSRDSKEQLDELKQNPTIGFLYDCTLSPDLRYASSKDEIGAVNNGPKDILFSTKIDDSTRQKLIELIVKYFEGDTQHRKVNNKRGFRIGSSAQKSVIALLKETKCLHESIDTYNATELHRVTTLFIEHKIGVDNVLYSTQYNEAGIFQEYDPNKHDTETAESKKYQQFKELETAFKKILA